MALRPFTALGNLRADYMEEWINKWERDYMKKWGTDPKESKFHQMIRDIFTGDSTGQSRRMQRWTPQDWNKEGRQSMIPHEFYADLDRMRPTPPPSLRAPLPGEISTGDRDMTGDTISAAPKETGIMQALSGLKEMVTSGIEAAKIIVQLTVNVDGHQVGSYIEELDRKNDKQAGRPAGSTFKKK
jgi:hypothetical protein